MKKYINPKVEIHYMSNEEIMAITLSTESYSGFGKENEGWDWSKE